MKNWKVMANELQDTLLRIVAKSNVLVEKYHAIVESRNAVEQENVRLREENEKLREEVERVGRENAYLRMARTIAPTPESVTSSKAMISRIVRDIDKCINQLNA